MLLAPFREIKSALQSLQEHIVGGKGGNSQKKSVDEEIDKLDLYRNSNTGGYLKEGKEKSRRNGSKDSANVDQQGRNSKESSILRGEHS